MRSWGLRPLCAQRPVYLAETLDDVGVSGWQEVRDDSGPRDPFFKDYLETKSPPEQHWGAVYNTLADGTLFRLEGR